MIYLLTLLSLLAIGGNLLLTFMLVQKRLRSATGAVESRAPASEREPLLKEREMLWLMKGEWVVEAQYLKLLRDVRAGFGEAAAADLFFLDFRHAIEIRFLGPVDHPKWLNPSRQFDRPLHLPAGRRRRELGVGWFDPSQGVVSGLSLMTEVAPLIRAKALAEQISSAAVIAVPASFNSR